MPSLRPPFATLAEGAPALRPGPQVVDAQTVHRGRLLVAIVEAVAAKGYPATTIADVVARARVSRRTFYEHFADKESCFLAAYDAAADLLLAAIEDAVTPPGRPWAQRLTAGVDAYLTGVAQEPALIRVFQIEVLGAGSRALARRRLVLRRFAELLRRLVAEGVRDEPRLHPLSDATALAIVGGVNELVLAAVEDDRIGEIPALREAAAELLGGVLTGAGG